MSTTTLARVNALTDICAGAQALSARITGELPGLQQLRVEDRHLIYRLKSNADMLVEAFRAKVTPDQWEDMLDAIGYMQSLQVHLAQLEPDRKVLALQLLAMVVDDAPELGPVRTLVAAMHTRVTAQLEGGGRG
jgi:hypothetical protein